MITSRDVDIYVNRYGIQATIPVVQYDSGRQFIFRVADASIPSGSTAYIFVRKPSGKSVYDVCTISGNAVTVTPAKQTFAEYGEVHGQVRISKNNEVVTSFDVIFDVKPSYVDNAEESKSGTTPKALINDVAVLKADVEAIKRKLGM
jgi:hypothetical protein